MHGFLEEAVTYSNSNLLRCNWFNTGQVYFSLLFFKCNSLEFLLLSAVKFHYNL